MTDVSVLKKKKKKKKKKNKLKTGYLYSAFS